VANYLLTQAGVLDSFNSDFVDLDDLRQVLNHLKGHCLRQLEMGLGRATDTWAANHDFLLEKLPSLRSLPVLSEKRYPDFLARKSIEEYWLIDPLDGKSEFDARIPEFCISIALIEGSRPVFSSLLVPSSKVTYWAEEAVGAFHEREGQALATIELPEAVGPKSRGLINRSPSGFDYASIYKSIGIEAHIPMGSSTKFSALIENQADIYYCKGGSREWNVAAADLLLREAGGDLLCLDTGGSLYYNQETSEVAPFVATAPSQLLSQGEFQTLKRASVESLQDHL